MTASASDLASALEQITSLLPSRAPRLGGARLVCVDGRSGSGKSTLAGALAERLREAGARVQVLELESAYAGWDGLLGTPGAVAESLLAPLAAGRSGTVRTWDWQAMAWSDDRSVAPLARGEVMVLEGVGAGARPITAYASLIVWCEAPESMRSERAAARDGGGDWWDAWAAQEDALLAADPVWERADLTWSS